VKRQPTAFQEGVLEATRDLLGRQGVSADFEWVDGEGESYAIGRLARDGRRYSIYIYMDDAGVYVDDDWYIWEHQDYDSLDELKTAFLQKLGNWLTGSPPPKREKRHGSFRRAPST
jgi:hypothetical protein